MGILKYILRFKEEPPKICKNFNYEVGESYVLYYLFKWLLAFMLTGLLQFFLAYLTQATYSITFLDICRWTMYLFFFGDFLGFISIDIADYMEKNTTVLKNYISYALKLTLWSFFLAIVIPSYLGFLLVLTWLLATNNGSWSTLGDIYLLHTIGLMFLLGFQWFLGFSLYNFFMDYTRDGDYRSRKQKVESFAFYNNNLFRSYLAMMAILLDLTISSKLEQIESIERLNDIDINM